MDKVFFYARKGKTQELIMISFFFGFLLSSLSYANNFPAFSDVARDADGSVSGMTFHVAKAYCNERGWHLPTAREYALLTNQQGGSGIRETEFPNISKDDSRVKKETEEMSRADFYPVYNYELFEKVVVDFYYNSKGYVAPSGDLGRERFWTASLYLSPGGIIYYQLYYGRLGIIWNASDHWDGHNAVRCVVSN
jgi:hypothetical protein